MIPCGASTWRARDGIVLLLLAAAGAGLCVTLYFLVVVSENGTADHAFTETFTSQGTAFVSFFKERLLAARALSDAIVSFPTLPTPDVMQMLFRSYVSVLTTSSVIMYLECVLNQPANISAWESAASARQGTNISVFWPPSQHASVGQHFIWVATDSSTGTNRSTATAVGRDVTSRAETRAAVTHMLTDIQNGVENLDASDEDDLMDSFGNSVGVPALHELYGSKAIGFAIITTLQPRRMDRLVQISSDINTFLSAVVALSPHVGVSVSDHTNVTVTHGACNEHEYEAVVKASVNITNTITWRLEIGECPGYRAQFVTWKRYVYVVMVFLATLLCMEVYRRIVRKNAADAARLKAEAQQQVHALIVGYVCHEVRNPLHIVKASFETIVGAWNEAVYGRGGSGSVRRTSQLHSSSHSLPNSASMPTLTTQPSLEGENRMNRQQDPQQRAYLISPLSSITPIHGSRSALTLQSTTVTADTTDKAPISFPSRTFSPPHPPSHRLTQPCIDEEDNNHNNSPTLEHDHRGGLDMESLRKLKDDYQVESFAVEDGSNAILQMLSTVNDILDMQALTNGKFKLSPRPTPLCDEVLTTLRRCRAFINDDVTLQYRLPPPYVIVDIDMLRLSQILTNAMSNAGKFVTAGGVIDVDIRVVDIPASFTHINLIKRQRSMSKDTSASGKLQPQQSQSQSNQCVIVTVSNSRLDAGRVTDASHMFIPFKSAAKHKSNSDSGQQVSSPRPPSMEVSGWSGVNGNTTEQHVQRNCLIWHDNRPSTREVLRRFDASPSPTVDDTTQPPATDNNGHTGFAKDSECVVGSIPCSTLMKGQPVRSSTGLGLPLCRSFAVAAGGWAFVEDSVTADAQYGLAPALSQSISRASVLPSRFSLSSKYLGSPGLRGATTHLNSIQGFTQFWAVFPITHSDIDEKVTPQDLMVAVDGCDEQLEGSGRQSNEDSRGKLVDDEVKREGDGNGGGVVEAEDEESVVGMIIEREASKDKVSLSARVTPIPIPPSLDDDTHAHHILHLPPRPLQHHGDVEQLHMTPSIVTTPTDNTSTPLQSPLNTFRVLVVDDEQANRRIATATLRRCGIPPENIITLEDGNAAYQYMSNPAQMRGISVVAMDVMLPGMSGIDIVTTLRHTLPCPVIAVTGNVEPSAVLELQQAGFSGCLAKPFSKRDMQLVVDKVLSAQRNGVPLKWFLHVPKD